MKLGLGRTPFGAVDVPVAEQRVSQNDLPPSDDIVDEDVIELSVATMRDLSWVFDRESEQFLALTA